MLKVKTLMGGLATAALIGIASPANALTITVDSQDWEISTIEGSFDELQSTLVDQVWWGNKDYATAFARAVQASESSTGLKELGLPNFLFPQSNIRDFFGPFFAYAAGPYIPRLSPGPFQIESILYNDDRLSPLATVGPFASSTSYVWAIGEPESTDPVSTPEPATAFSLLALGLGTIATKRKLSSPAKR